ncbi:MAG: hypothetical protein GF331_12120 [Chitinivibrionales bacterium]|nr:hypothetical protein [Chitinivibrionales bacterium]
MKKGGRMLTLAAVPTAVLGLLLAAKKVGRSRRDGTGELDNRVRQTIENSEDKILELVRAMQDRTRVAAESIDDKAIDRIVNESKENLDKLGAELKGRLSKAKPA